MAHKKILITDDAAFMRTILGGILRKAEYDIVEASSGIDAIEKYKTEKPDAVTMDITMPEMDGITALKQIMAIDKDAKVLMCSAMGQQAMVIEAIKVGAKDFIVKPFDANRVVDALNRLFVAN